METLTENKIVYVLELDGSKAIYLSIGELSQSLECELENMVDNDSEDKFLIYTKKMTKKEINELPEFEGW